MDRRTKTDRKRGLNKDIKRVIILVYLSLKERLNYVYYLFPSY